MLAKLSWKRWWPSEAMKKILPLYYNISSFSLPSPRIKVCLSGGEGAMCLIQSAILLSEQLTLPLNLLFSYTAVYSAFPRYYMHALLNNKTKFTFHLLKLKVTSVAPLFNCKRPPSLNESALSIIFQTLNPLLFYTQLCKQVKQGFDQQAFSST